MRFLGLLTLGARVTVVEFVCVSVCKSPLTSGASVHPVNTVAYSMDNEGPKICKTASF